MKDQHEKITGYRDLTQDEIDAMNRVKEMGEELDDMLRTLATELPGIDSRWLAIGRTDLQKGLMSVVRSIAKPTTF